MGEGVLAVWTDIDPAVETEFNDWYMREHLPERVALSGFLHGARYRTLAGSPAYLAWYATNDAAVLSSPAYRARLDRPTARTRRIMPHFRNTVRTVFRVAERFGHGTGGVAATLRVTAQPERGAGLDAWLAETALRGIAEMNGVVGAQLWLTDPAADGGETAETGLRGPDRTAERAILVEASDTTTVQAACRAWLAPAALRHAGAAETEVGTYVLLHRL